MTFQILASDGSEETGAAPAWLIVDESDCEIVQVPLHDGDSIDDAIERFIAAGHLPEGAHLENTELMGYPYPWQLAGYEYRWTVAG